MFCHQTRRHTDHSPGPCAETDHWWLESLLLQEKYQKTVSKHLKKKVDNRKIESQEKKSQKHIIKALQGKCRPQNTSISRKKPKTVSKYFKENIDDKNSIRALHRIQRPQNNSIS